MAKEKKLEKKDKKEVKTKIVKATKNNQKKEKKQSLYVKFRIFCHGVKSEFSKIHWTSQKDLVTYSIATICFLIFFGLFFYVIDLLFALVQSLI